MTFFIPNRYFAAADLAFNPDLCLFLWSEVSALPPCFLINFSCSHVSICLILGGCMVAYVIVFVVSFELTS